MARWLRRLVRWIPAALLFGGCSNTADSTRVSGTIRVRLPVVDAQGHESFEERQMTEIEDLSVMRTKFAHFYFAPKLTSSGPEGASVHTHFTKTNSGLYVPLDSNTQQVAMIAAELEDLSVLDQAVGVHQLLTWPLAVGVSVRLVDADGQVENNSFYDAGADAILFVPYDDSAHLPLSLNRGVIAHEHFHALFDRFVMRPLVKADVVNPDLRSTGESAKIDRTLFVKAVNEGLADVWGWIHSGDFIFVGRSLAKQMDFRNLKVTRSGPLRNWGDLPFRASLTRDIEFLRVNDIHASKDFNGYAYGPGASFARVIVQIFNEEVVADQVQARGDLALRLSQALPKISDLLKKDREHQVDFIDLMRTLLSVQPLTQKQRQRVELWLPQMELP